MKHLLFWALAAFLLFSLHSCQESTEELEDQVVPQKVIDKLKTMGFNPDGIEVVEEGYRIERDIIIRESDLESLDFHAHDHKGRTDKQYSTNNLVSSGGNRNISIYIPTGGNGFNSNYVNALDMAIARFNSENLELTFSRTNSRRNADIKMRKLSKRDENRGVLGSAGFPSGGDPYDQIKMSSIIDTGFGWSTEAIATVMAHEIGHCIGFRHTDYFDRSLSCGGNPVNEGSAGVGANHIPGTPTGFSAESWMLSCSGGGDRPFNQDDKVALDFLY